jgi:NADPH-dependent ferric siderophore reductase
VTSSSAGEGPARGRRPPPPWRRVQVRRTQRLTARLGRVTLAGDELQGLTVAEPAASVRVLLPAPDGTLTIPAWTGNEFLLPDGRRPTIRTLTPRRVDADNRELDVEIVIHDRGAASAWAEAASPGGPAAVSGPARGYRIDPNAADFWLAGDETALPAISQLLEGLPEGKPVRASIEIARPDARLADLPVGSGAGVDWLDQVAGAPPGDALVAAVRHAELGPHTAVWVAGEAAAVQRVRRHLFEERGFPRTRATVRGYWKHGRDAGSGDEP